MDSDPKPEVNGVFLNMRDENSILETGDLAIGFKGRNGSDEIIFEKINVSAGKGELVALFGPNGIGKSTLLRNLVRLQLPVSGEIFLFNQNIRSFSRTRLAKKTGICFNGDDPYK
jgi:iron complex transport system ATP-binding protein